MSASTKDALSQADIIFNRTNVALARSQRLIASWLPPKPEAGDQDSPQAAADEDDDFRGDSEIGGIGSAVQRDDSGLPEGAFKRRNPAANDKLLDSLLGKKAANAHRKAQQEARGGAGAQIVGSKPLVKEAPKRPAKEVESDDEEGGRAAAFKSKRARSSKPQPKSTDDDAESDANANVAKDDEETRTTDIAPKAPQESSSGGGKGGGKKRPASYLDELLGQKANKKSKKKKKTAA